MDYSLLLFLSFLSVVILVPVFLKERTKRAGFDLIARALERGQVLDPETIMRLSTEQQRADRGRNNLGIGVVLSTLAVGSAAAAMILSNLEDAAPLQDFLVPAVVIGAVGLAFLLLSALDYLTQRK